MISTIPCLDRSNCHERGTGHIYLHITTFHCLIIEWQNEFYFCKYPQSGNYSFQENVLIPVFITYCKQNLYHLKWQIVLY